MISPPFCRAISDHKCIFESYFIKEGELNFTNYESQSTNFFVKKVLMTQKL